MCMILMKSFEENDHIEIQVKNTWICFNENDKKVYTYHYFTLSKMYSINFNLQWERVQCTNNTDCNNRTLLKLAKMAMKRA